MTELFGAGQQVVRDRVATEERLAVVGFGRLGVGPFVIALRERRDSLDRLELVERRAGLLREDLPIGHVDLNGFGRLADGQHLQPPVAREIALGEEAVDERVLLLGGKVRIEIGHLAHAVDDERRIGVRKEDGGHRSRTDELLGRGRHRSRQIVHATLARMGNRNADFLAFGGVEVGEEILERLLLMARVVGPHFDLHRIGGVELLLRCCLLLRRRAPRKHEQRRQRSCNKRTRTDSHKVIPLSSKRKAPRALLAALYMTATVIYSHHCRLYQRNPIGNRPNHRWNRR